MDVMGIIGSENYKWTARSCPAIHSTRYSWKGYETGERLSDKEFRIHAVGFGSQGRVLSSWMIGSNLCFWNILLAVEIEMDKRGERCIRKLKSKDWRWWCLNEGTAEKKMVPGYLGGKNSYDVDLLHVGAWVESKSPDCRFREFCGCWCQPLKLKNRRRAGLEEDKSCFRHVELEEPVGHPRRESGVQWYVWFRTGGTNWGNETRVEITLRVCREGSGWWRGWQLTSEEGEWLRAGAPL